jgi:23S rRNA (uracil1939-C5)-methyltransferase
VTVKRPSKPATKSSSFKAGGAAARSQQGKSRQGGGRPAPSAPTEEMTVDIAYVGAQGDGVVQTPRIFVPLALPGEGLRVLRQGDHAEILEVLTASPDRIAPVCQHFGDCGGCAFQNWSQEPYLAWKTQLVRSLLGREGIETEFLPAYAAAPGSRRRLALHARRGAGGAELGFKARRSWRLVGITECSVADPRLVAALPALRRLALPFLEHPKSAPTLHVTLTRTGLDIDITGVEAKSGGLSMDARIKATQIAGECDFARVTLAGEILYQARQPMVSFGPATVALPAGSFLQADPSAEAAMADDAVAAFAGSKGIADLFCGAGAFTFRLAQIAPVYAADTSAPAVRALTSAIGSASGLKPITAEARDLDRRPVLSMELKKIDSVLFDPPRAGAEVQCGEIARSTVSRVVAVSCNPVTFARDAKILVDAGFVLKTVRPVDQFLWSPHIEVVATFER